jgi:hypothetical protein
MRRPLSLLSLRDSFPSPARGEGQVIGDLPWLAAFVERNEGELALSHDGFRFAVAVASDGFGLEA